jgi:hypothetical protein
VHYVWVIVYYGFECNLKKKNHARVSFVKDYQFEVFEKLTSVCFFKFHETTILSLINNIQEKKLCSHVRMPHLEIKEIKKFEK